MNMYGLSAPSKVTVLYLYILTAYSRYEHEYRYVLLE